MRIVKEEPVVIEVVYDTSNMKCVSNSKKMRIRRIYCYDKEKNTLIFTAWIYPLKSFLKGE